MKKNKVIIAVGVLLFVFAIILGALDLYRMTSYEHVDSMLRISYRKGAGKKAHVSYEYQGVKYEDKVLSAYNAFTMKDGKSYTVLIDPDVPENPYTTSFALDLMILAGGVASIYAGRKKE